MTRDTPASTNCHITNNSYSVNNSCASAYKTTCPESAAPGNRRTYRHMTEFLDNTLMLHNRSGIDDTTGAYLGHRAYMCVVSDKTASTYYRANPNCRSRRY